MPWYANLTSNTFVAKTDRLKRFDQYLVPNFFQCQYFLGRTYCAYQFLHILIIDLCCDFLWNGQLSHIGICIWGSVLFPLSRASVWMPLLHWYPSKNELTPVLIHLNKSTQHHIRPIYRPGQQSTHISLILKLYVRQVRHRKLPRCCLDNANEAESMLPQLFSSSHWCKVWFYANDPVRVSPWNHKFLQHFFTIR